MKNNIEKEPDDKNSEEYQKFKMKRAIQGFGLIMSLIFVSGFICYVLSSFGLIELPHK